MTVTRETAVRVTVTVLPLMLALLSVLRVLPRVMATVELALRPLFFV